MIFETVLILGEVGVKAKVDPRDIARLSRNKFEILEENKDVDKETRELFEKLFKSLESGSTLPFENKRSTY